MTNYKSTRQITGNKTKPWEKEEVYTEVNDIVVLVNNAYLQDG